MSASFQYNPYLTGSFSATASESATSLGRSSASTYLVDECDGCPTSGPTVVYRNRHAFASVKQPNVDIAELISQWRSGSVATMGQYLSAHKDQLDALITTLIVDSSVLRYASSAHGGLLISTVLKLIPDDIRGNVLLEVIVSNTELVVDLATETIALQNIYDMAGREWKLRLHQVLIPRLAELCYHPQGNYMISHILRAFPIHQDARLIAAATAVFSDGNDLVAMCQDRAAVCVAVVWASVVPASLAQASVLSLLQHPKASFAFYRLSMSGVAYKVVASLLRHLTNTELHHLITTILTKHVRGARYAGKIRSAIGAQKGRPSTTSLKHPA